MFEVMPSAFLNNLQTSYTSLKTYLKLKAINEYSQQNNQITRPFNEEFKIS